jgi:hypothetical protein
MDADSYAALLLDRYRRLPGTLGYVLTDDRKTARKLHAQGIGLDMVEHAFCLALARRNACAAKPPPIRTLRYFLPVIEEIAAAPLDPGYLRYLENRNVGLQ